MESKTNNNRITMFGEVYADNKPVLAVLELSPNNNDGLSLDEIKIASAYGKDNAQNFIDTSKILYIDKNKNRVSTFETSTGLQLPVGGADSTDSIRQTSEESQEKFSMENPLENTQFDTTDVDNQKEKSYNKKNYYNETETLFLQWQNSSAPVGEVKKFFRF